MQAHYLSTPSKCTADPWQTEAAVQGLLEGMASLWTRFLYETVTAKLLGANAIN